MQVEKHCWQNIREDPTLGNDVSKWDGQTKSWIWDAQIQVLSVSVQEKKFKTLL